MDRKILVIDDDRLNLTLLKFALRESGFIVSTALNGRLGLEEVKAFEPDLIILDIQMPEMSGFDFMNELKVRSASQMIPVIMLTSNATMQDLFFSEGVRGYFVKPVIPDKLIVKINECLS